MKKLLARGASPPLALATPPPPLARPMTATDLATLRRSARPPCRRTGAGLVYQLRETDLAANRGRTDLWLLDLRAPARQPVRIA